MAIDAADTATQKRAYALDALRGFAILTMVLSGLIPYEVLPAWMYHAQEPPPTHTYNPNLAGLTWVDLVFPLFLFSMGAAIPLALSRRMKKGWDRKRIVLSILKRGFLLGAFAIFLQHVRPHKINPNPTEQTWWIALLGFLILFFMFVRLPSSLKPVYGKAIALCAWLAAIILLAFLRYPDGKGFSIDRSDIILILLANTAVFGSIIWLYTKSNLLSRLGLLGALTALRLSATADGWIAQLLSASPIPWIFKVEYLQYLFLVVPGTIAGDLILSWMQTPTTDDRTHIAHHWTPQRFTSIILLMFAICVLLLVGLQARLIWQTTLLSAALCSVGWLLFASPVNETETLLNNLYRWGVYWLGIGLLFEPYEGGIKKDNPTMSYYFVTTAMAIFISIAFTIIIDIFKKHSWLQLLIDNGQNPMIAYVGFANFIWPILALTRIHSWALQNTKAPQLGLLRGFIYTLLLACLVSLFTRLKIFWRT